MLQALQAAGGHMLQAGWSLSTRSATSSPPTCSLICSGPQTFFFFLFQGYSPPNPWNMKIYEDLWRPMKIYEDLWRSLILVIDRSWFYVRCKILGWPWGLWSPCGPAASTAFREVRHEVHVDVFGPVRQQKTVCCGWLDQVIYNTYSIVIWYTILYWYYILI